MKYINKVVLWCSLFLFGMVQAQESDFDKAKAIIYKVKSFYDAQSQYSVNVNYTLYDGNKGNSVLETYDGILVKNDQDFYSKIHNTESLQVANHYVKVNHDEKAVLYGETKNESQKVTGLDLEMLFKNFNKAVITEKESLYLIEMVAPPISQSPYGKAILEINKNDLSLNKQTLFFSSTIPVKNYNGDEKLTNPRLEVVLTNFSQNNQKYKSKFNITAFVIQSKAGNKVSPKLKNYQFIDTTRK